MTRAAVAGVLIDDGVYDTPLGQFSMVDTSTVGVMPVPQRSAAGKHVAESFPKTHRSVLALSWLSSNRAWSDIHGREHPVLL